MARPRKHDGVVYRRNDSNVWWMRYRDKDGTRCLESTNTTDWDDAQRQLRERLAARDDNSLEVLRKGKNLSFNEWVDFFLVNYSKPPIRAQKTHQANETALRTLRPAFARCKLVEIGPNEIEDHLRSRLQAKRRVPRRGGIAELGTLKATTVSSGISRIAENPQCRS